jgi:hypothetical protein
LGNGVCFGIEATLRFTGFDLAGSAVRERKRSGGGGNAPARLGSAVMTCGSDSGGSSARRSGAAGGAIRDPGIGCTLAP